MSSSDLVPPSSWHTGRPDLQLVHKELFLHHPLSLSDGNTLELPLSDPTHFYPDTPPLSAARVLLDEMEGSDEDSDDLAGKCKYDCTVACVTVGLLLNSTVCFLLPLVCCCL